MAALTSSSEPTATMRLPETATAVAAAAPRSIVITFFAVNIVIGVAAPTGLLPAQTLCQVLVDAAVGASRF